MRNEQNPMSRFLAKWQKPRFWVIFDTKVPKYAKFEFSRKIGLCHFFFLFWYYFCAKNLRNLMTGNMIILSNGLRTDYGLRTTDILGYSSTEVENCNVLDGLDSTSKLFKLLKHF